MAPNRYYSDAHPDKESRGPGKDDGIHPTQKKGTGVGHETPSDALKFTAHPDNVKKDGMGLGNKATTKQKLGEASKG